ncbi:MAG TPA: hypothetical protein VGH37_15780 [Candidatus Acidoferrum sp.]|jgi:hypothetical protein
MSLVTEVSREVVKSAGRVAAGVELRNIFLLEGKAALAPQFVEAGCQFPKKGWSVKTGHRGKFTIDRKKTLRTTLQFNFNADEKESKGKPLLVIAATFLAEYEMAEGFNPSVEELNSFVHANAVFNCWPYWREYVHSTAARMNLPPLTLPFFRVRTPQSSTRPLERGVEPKQIERKP